MLNFCSCFEDSLHHVFYTKGKTFPYLLHKLASSNQSFRRKRVFCQASIDAGSDLFGLLLVIDSFQFEWQNCICSLDKCKNCDSVQVCRLNFQTMTEQSISFLRLKALCLAQEFRKIAEMTRHDLWLQVYFQLGCHLNHCNVSHCFLQLIFLTKRRTTQWLYEKTIATSKCIQNTCSGSWFLCKEWKQVTLSEATLGRHLCSTNHVVIVWERG